MPFEENPSPLFVFPWYWRKSLCRMEFSLLYRCSQSSQPGRQQERSREGCEELTADTGRNKQVVRGHLQPTAEEEGSGSLMTLATSQMGETGFRTPACTLVGQAACFQLLREQPRQCTGTSSLQLAVTQLWVLQWFLLCAITCSSHQHSDEETRGMLLGINDPELRFCYSSTTA